MKVTRCPYYSVEKLMQDLVTEAFNDLFAKYNVPQTAKAASKT